MSDYPLSDDDLITAATPATRSRGERFRERFAAAGEDLAEDHFDWDSAALVEPGGISPARQLAMQRQQERLSSMTRKPEAAAT